MERDWKITSFDELVAPLSKDKTFILVELVDEDALDQMENYLKVKQYLKIDFDANEEDYEKFRKLGYMFLEYDDSVKSQREAVRLIDYFRGPGLKDALRLYLFINEQFIEHSGMKMEYEAAEAITV